MERITLVPDNKLQDLAAKIAALLQLPAAIINPKDLVALLERAAERAFTILLQQQRDDEIVTRKQFLEEQLFGLSYWFKLKKFNRIPRMITDKTMRRGAVREWQARMEAESVNGPPRLAYERRQVLASKAGRIGGGRPPRGKIRKKRSLSE